MNYLIRVAYDGSKFYGFQRLNEEDSVQKKIEDALSDINKSDVIVKGAGRTDRGVHAMDQCVSFKLDINIDESGLKRALNSRLQPYIYVKSVEIVNEDFHARFNVVNKTYVYKLNLGEYNPIEADYVYQCPYELDIEKMKQVAKLFLGVHNFHNFVSGKRDNYECIVYAIDFNIENDILKIKFKGKSFYRYMVRNLVGAMVEVGRGKVEIDKIKEMLDSNEEMSCYTAPACGLYLMEICYEK